MVPLIVRSHYSLMRGTASPGDLCRAARAMGYTRLALTDTDNLYGLGPFLAACRREGIAPMVGAEVTDPQKRARAVCLVEEAGGYANLCRLLTRRHRDPAFDLGSALPGFAAGLTVLTDHPGLLAAWRDAGVRTAGIMGRRPLPPGHPLTRTARRLGVPMAAAPDSFFVAPEEHAVHCLLRAIDRNTVLSRLPPGDVAPADARLAPTSVYARRFAPCPGALDAAREIADRLAFTGPDFGVVMPPWPENGDGAGTGDADQALRRAAYRGARRRYGDELPEPTVERLERELRTIAEMGFSAYFLVVREIIRPSPRICGRGSGAASLVAYCLGITNVCPLAHNLYFERFLNPGRTDPPDIDVDFAWDERDGVLATVLSRHRGRCAMVANHVLFQPRMAVRETAKVFGMTDAEIGRVARCLPWHVRGEGRGADLPEILAARPQARNLDLPPPWPEILALAGRIIGTPRYLSVHPGGVVITPGPIDAYVPVEDAPKGVPVIQWEKDAAEDFGLVKIDLLGNRSLGVIRDAVAGIRKNGVPFAEEGWAPEADPETQEALGQGRTMGCFYIESPAMRLLQQKTGVGDFDHLVIHSSIIRPAANDVIQEYIRRLHGGAWDPLHPLLADVLDETFGLMVYQEDVSRAAVSLAGFSHAEADGLRKILSKKDREHALRDCRERFEAGAWARGVPAETIARVWEMIMSFNGYSFCKPHSASYARVSFQAAYLKVHHPAEFMAAVISNGGGFYATFAYVSEAKRMGLSVAPPDVNISGVRWRGGGKVLRVGLMAVKGLGTGTRERILSGRQEGEFRGLRDFLDRTGPDEDEARALIRCGALDAFSRDGNRAGLLWGLARWVRSRRKGPAQGRLFAPAEETPPPLPPEDPVERLRREFAVLGFLCDRHPMELFGDRLRSLGTVKVARLGDHLDRPVRIGAWLVTGKTVRTKKGDPMTFLTFEDETGIMETTFFPRTYRRCSHLLAGPGPFLLRGRPERDWGAVTFTVEGAVRL